MIYPSHHKQHDRLQSSNKAIKLLPNHAFTSVRQPKHIKVRLTLLKGSSKLASLNRLPDLTEEHLQVSLKKSFLSSGKASCTD